MEVIYMTLTSAGMTSSLRSLLVYFHISTTTADFVCWIIMIVNWSLYEKYNQYNKQYTWINIQKKKTQFDNILQNMLHEIEH